MSISAVSDRRDSIWTADPDKAGSTSGQALPSAKHFRSLAGGGGILGLAQAERRGRGAVSVLVRDGDEGNIDCHSEKHTLGSNLHFCRWIP